jgi:DNA-binding XRE family transcriptional regulator
MKNKLIKSSEVFGKMPKKKRAYIENRKKYYSTLMDLYKVRSTSGITQQELADRSGIPRATISKIESGVRNVTIETLMKLAEALGKKLEINLV